MVLRDEVQTSSFHQQLFPFKPALHLYIVEAMLLALVCHGIGALATSSTHDISSL